MPGQGRFSATTCFANRYRNAILGLLFCSLAIHFASSADAQTIQWPQSASWQDDAELTDLFFLNRETGWVVGDRGLVLRTTDGGKTWNEVPLKSDLSDPESSVIQCRLESVFFASNTHGWIAGGYRNPQSTTSRGVLFRTIDGGQTWKRVQGLNMAAIKQLHFYDRHRGTAVGDGNALQPAGIYKTSDGGVTWSIFPGGKRSSWKNASLVGDRIVLTGGNSGGISAENTTLGLFTESKLQDAYLMNTRPIVVHEMKMLDNRYGFAVGDFGALLQTQNGGLSWEPTTDYQGIPEPVTDLQTIATTPNRMWIAGSPGTVVFRLDAGDSAWQSFPTPLNTSINKLVFLDNEYGWAIGSCGQIIQSEDGGQTWTTQRKGAKGVALLEIAMSPSDFHPELFSRYCAQGNYLGGGLLLSGIIRNENSNGGPGLENRVTFDALQQAITRCGGSLVQSIDFSGMERNDALNDLLLEKLVCRIRCLRPRVIAIPSSPTLLTSKSQTVSVDLQHIVRLAVAAAADRNQFPNQLTDLGLSEWQTGKVVVANRGDISNISIPPGQYLTGLSALVSDHVMVSQMLLGQNPHQKQAVSLTTIYTSPWAAGSDSTLFGSIENTDAGVQRREGRRTTAGNLTQMRMLASKQKSLEKLIESAPHQQLKPAVWNTNLAEMNLKLNPATAGVWMYELAIELEKRGLVSLALQTHLYLTKNLREHPLATASFGHLYNHYSSAEQAWIAGLQLQVHQASQIEEVVDEAAIRSRPVTRMVEGQPVTTWELIENSDPRGQANSMIGLASWTEQQQKELNRRRYQQARSITTSTALLDESAFYTGANWLSRCRLNRKLDALISLDNQLKEIAQSPLADRALAEIAQKELRILNHKEGSTDPAVPCNRADKRPWLDGVLSEEIWSQQKSNGVSLVSIGAYSANDNVRVACDDQFLYLSIACEKQPDVSYRSDAEKEASPRQRDADLTMSDRLEIAIDIDRDYKTYYLFSVDCDGKVAESMGNNLAWNPTWYVATSQDEKSWTVEISIPLDELSTNGDVWAMSVGRFVRDRPVSTTLPAITNESKAGSSKDSQEKIIDKLKMSSLHQAAQESRADQVHLSLDSFWLVRMPWSGGNAVKTMDLPRDQ